MIKYYSKIEKRIKELIINKYCLTLKKLVFKKSDLFSKHTHLYLLLVKTVYRNILDYTRILVAIIIIFFFEKTLFLYFVYALPFFVLFYLLAKRVSLSSKINSPMPEADFGLLIRRLMDSKVSPKVVKKKVIAHLESNLQKKINNKSKSTSLNVAMNSFINFFRLAYLAYFGYYIVSSDLRIEGLIVGLLFITILIKPIISILRSIPLYQVCKNSFFKINSLFRV
jgi:hypothetical protein